MLLFRGGLRQLSPHSTRFGPLLNPNQTAAGVVFFSQWSHQSQSQSQSHSQSQSQSQPEQQQPQPQQEAIPQEENTTHFGFQTVRKQDKTRLVADVFHRVAEKYDLMNDLMSGGIHRLWKDQFIGVLSPLPGTALLDVASGTGDIAFRFMEAIRASPNYYPHAAYPSYHKHLNAETQAAKRSLFSPESKVVVCDINESMLNVGRERADKFGYSQWADPKIHWAVGDAENLPMSSESFDAYTISFGIRNCTNLYNVLTEAHRVLKPGGRFLCLEFSSVQNPILSSIYNFYSFNFIPVMGQIVANDYASYQYLVESIRKFPTQEEFARLMRLAGFSHVTYQNLTFGVVAIHSGFKF